jgi:nitrogen fixation/metabolism regulation signal transduction histidine kinase
MKNKFKRTHFFIDKEIQGKYMITLLVPMLIMLTLFSILLFFTLTFGIQFSLDSLNNQISEQVSFSLQGISNPTSQNYASLLGAIKELANNFSQNDQNREQLVYSLLWVVIPGFLIIIGQLVFLTIFFSHKLAGPVYRIELGCRRVTDGDFTENIRLRDSDQLVRLANHFNDVISKSRETINALYKADTKEEKDIILQNIKIELDS